MFYRLYTSKDGQSHLEEHAPPEHVGATEIVFRESQPGEFIDWHTAPRRQYIVTLAGQVEIGLGSGTVYTLGPGDMMLAEDLTGKGHTTRTVGTEPRVSIAIPVA